MKRVFLVLFCCLFSFLGAQNLRVEGRVFDKTSNEPLIGASVVYATGKGVSTDLEGKFSVSLAPGDYVFTVTYVGYAAQQVSVRSGEMAQGLDIGLMPTELKQFDVVADLARPRETPIAYSNISAQSITEKLGSQDLPMLLNATPGVYATQLGGGDGDARVSIRGFSSQNVLVMIDGIPMNDMFNGRVFWTNWFGLDQMTETMQVQRGLGASKLAIPAIGGTLNIMTKGLSMRKGINIKQEVGNNMNFRTVVSASTGMLEGGWNIQGALAFRSNEGWVNGLRSRMFFGYLKVNKQLGKHTLSLTAFGAPQESGQRSFFYGYGIEQLDKNYALSLGVDTSSMAIERGNRYYYAWNHLVRIRDANPELLQSYFNKNISLEELSRLSGKESEFLNTTQNAFFKPVISLRDFWAVNDKLFFNNSIYFSAGRGGGTRAMNKKSLVQNQFFDSNGQIDLQFMYENNAFNPFSSYTYTDSETGESFRRSQYYIQRDHNDHNWIGTLSTVDYRAGRGIHLSGGIDSRYYNGRVYSTLHDALGGDLILINEDLNRKNDLVRRVGDTINQHISRDILWGGVFGMVEFKGERLTAFVNLSAAANGYKQYHHFLKKQLKLGDSTYNIGYYDTLTLNDEVYTRESEKLQTASSDWVTRFGYTLKGGANYNLHSNHNVFFNVGYFSRVPLFTFLIGTANNKLSNNNRNEELSSFELGYTYSSRIFSANLNAYYTLWFNRPTTFSITLNDEATLVNVNDMGARHMGVELDWVLKVHRMLKLEGMVSIGDWIWNSRARGDLFDIDGSLLAELEFDPRGLKVGDAAQHSYAFNLRFMPHKRIYIMPEINIFTHNYAQFNPNYYTISNIEAGTGPNIGRQAWRMPDYYFINVHAGYHFNIKQTRIDIRANVLNVLDQLYLTDARDNQLGSIAGFSAANAIVYAGLGLRWMGALSISF
jgi:iron complex outermembrane receptor protein